MIADAGREAMVNGARKPKPRHLEREVLGRLRERFFAYGTTAHVSHMSGVPIGTLQKMIRGATAPSFATMAALARTIDVSLDWLATGDSNPTLSKAKAPTSESLRDGWKVGLDMADGPDRSVEGTFCIEADGRAALLDIRETPPANQPPRLPCPTQPWQGALHRAFAATPEDTSAAALRLRIAELERQIASLSSAPAAAIPRDVVIEWATPPELIVDEYYNGGVASADKREPWKSGTAGVVNPPEDFIPQFLLEMAAWPPVYEDRPANPIIRFFKWLAS